MLLKVLLISILVVGVIITGILLAGAISSQREGTISASTEISTPLAPSTNPLKSTVDFHKSVVRVSTPRGTGTGFVVDSNGGVLTNAHVVGPSRSVMVGTEAEKSRAVVVGVDHHMDLAYIRWRSAIERNLRPIKLASPVPTVLVSIPGFSGNTQELVVVDGRVSAIADWYGYDSLITDAVIKNGNSGSPMLNLAGQAVGMIYALGDDDGLGISADSILSQIGILTSGESSVPIPTELTPPVVAEELKPLPGWTYYGPDCKGYDHCVNQEVEIPPFMVLQSYDRSFYQESAGDGTYGQSYLVIDCVTDGGYGVTFGLPETFLIDEHATLSAITGITGATENKNPLQSKNFAIEYNAHNKYLGLTRIDSEHIVWTIEEAELAGQNLTVVITTVDGSGVIADFAISGFLRNSHNFGCDR